MQNYCNHIPWSNIMGKDVQGSMNPAAQAIWLVMLMLCSSMLPFTPPALEAEEEFETTGRTSSLLISMIRGFQIIETNPLIQNSSIEEWEMYPSPPNGIALNDGTDMKPLDGDFGHTCAILDNGSMACWGMNNHYQLGDQTTCSEYVNNTDCPFKWGKNSPVYVNFSDQVLPVSVDTTYERTCAIMSDHSVRCWGREYAPGPNNVSLTSIFNPSAITVGEESVCIVLTDGNVQCLGKNGHGQLGNSSRVGNNWNSTFADVSLPVNSSAVRIASEYRHACALLDNGSVACWGNNENGQLGDWSVTGSTNNSVFARLPQNRTAVDIDVGDIHSCAELDNGSAFCWGYGGDGRLGNGLHSTQPNPNGTFVSLPENRTVSQLDLGSGNACALLDNGSILCWGDEKGLTPTIQPLPLNTTALRVSAQGDATCAVLANHTTNCWVGASGSAIVRGVLGDGTWVPKNSTSSLPVNFSIGRTVDLSLLAGSLRGVPSNLQSLTNYTVWGNTSSGGSQSLNFSIEVLPALDYGNTTISLTRNTTMTPRTPVINGGPYAVTISPPLPSGLSLNNTTGEITGTPTLDQILKQYTITATNSSGSDQFTIYIGVADIPPSISYSNSNYTFIRGWAIDSEELINDGGNINTLRSNDTMPLGLTINEEDISRTTLTANDHDLRFFIGTDGHIYGWGDVYNGRIGTNAIGRSGSGLDQVNPTIFTLFMTSREHVSGNPSIDYEAIEIRTLGGASCALFSNNSIGCWGNNGAGILGFNHSWYGDKDNCAFPANHSNSEINCGGWLESLENQVSTFSFYSNGIDRVNGCAILLNDELWCWGRNVGNSEHNATPRKVDLNGRRAEQILDSECVLLHDGNITCWSTIDNTTDVSLPAGRTAIQVGYGCAILDNHSVYCWSGSVTWPPIPNGLKPIRLQTNGCMILSNGSAYCVPQSGSPFYAPRPPSRTFIAIDDYRVDSIGVPAGGCGLLDNTSIICWGGWSGNGTSGVITGEYGWATMPTGVGGLSPGGIFGTLSGTPLIDGQFHRTIWGNNSLGASSFNMSIEVLLALDYGNPTIGLARNVTMPTATPIITGGPYSLSISPSLPSGLSFNNSTGAISGTPLFDQSTQTYYISVSNSSGADVIEITIGIADVAPILNYAETNLTYVRGFWDTPLHPILSGGNVASWEISPNLPSGLIFSSNSSNNFERPLNTGDRYTLSITESGKVLISTWSGMSYLSISSTVHPIAIETTAYHTTNSLSTYAIRFDDGSVWWNNTFLQVYQNEYVIDVALAERHWCYLLDSGSVRCWGTNEYGGFGDGTPASNIWRNQTNTSNVTLPAGRFAIGISSGGSYTCAILDNMELFCWGMVPSIPSLISANNITQLETDYYHAYGICALLDIGSISCSSGNYNPPTGRTFKQLGGGKILCALLDNNSVVCYSDSQNDWEYVQFPSGIIPSYLSVRWGTACVIIQDGRQMCWGEGNFLQLGNGNNVDSTTPVFSTLPSGESIHRPFQIGCIFGSSQVSTNAINYTVWANNSLGSSIVNLTIMVLPGVEYPSAWVNLTRNVTMSPFLPVINIDDINLSIYPPLPAGLVFNYTTGEISGTPLVPWQPIEYTVSLWNSTGFDRFIFTLFVSEILPNATYEHSNHDELVGFAIEPIIPSNDAGTVHQWGISPSLPDGLSFTLNAMGQTFSAGGSSTCAIYSDQTLRCWGANDMTQLGDGTVTASSVPVLVNFADGAVPIEVAVGGEHACAIIDDGSVRCWGRNDVGQVGTGTFCIYGSLADGCNGNFGVSSPSTVLLPTGLNATSISAGASHTCALLEDGSIYCWGSNSDSQIGDGSSDDIATPAAVILPSGRYAVRIGMGGSFSCAVLDNSSAVCWGANAFGQLGDGSTEDMPIPSFVELPAGRSVVAINGGGSHTCALLDAGDVACWGRNTHGQLGDGTTIGKIYPQVVTLPAGRTAVSVGVGDLHSCALLDDGVISCWGSNQNGLIGGGGAHNSTPSSLLSNNNLSIISIELGDDHTCVLLITSRLSCIGTNTDGQFGDGSQNSSSSLTYSNAISGAILTTPYLSAGTLYGTPSVSLVPTLFSIHANNSIGDMTVLVTLGVDVPFEYTETSLVLLRNRVMSDITPTVANGNFESFIITPELISGLNINPSTGGIGGTPQFNSTLTEYTIILNNSTGFYSKVISIVIHEPAANISFTGSPFIFTRGVDIGTHIPIVEGGIIEFWGVEPMLPAGLMFFEGIISGVPQNNITTTVYRIWGNNSGGVGWIDIEITILEPPPSLVLQSNQYTLIRNETELNFSISNIGGMVAVWNISPELPDGLHFQDGIIYGIPTVNQSSVNYTITASNSGGQHSVTFTLLINEPIPIFEYSQSNLTFTRGMMSELIVPSNTGGTIHTWMIEPLLPEGLIFENGLIFGTPLVNLTRTTFTVSASNSGGTTEWILALEILEPAPVISYPDDILTLTLGASMDSITPMDTGGMIETWTISPQPPAGVFFDSVTGKMAGSPLAITPPLTYVITATNSGGQSSFTMVIEVKEPLPEFNLPSGNLHLVEGVEMSQFTPFISDVTISSWSYQTSDGILPSGLQFNPSTGGISGTPTVPSEAIKIIIIAMNDGGEFNRTLTIEVLSDFDGDGIADIDDEDDDNDGVSDSKEKKDGSDPFDSSSIPVEGFELLVPGTTISLGAWDLIGILGGVPLFSWLAFGMLTRNNRSRRFEERLKAVQNHDELEDIANDWERSLKFRLLGPHQGIRLERLRIEIENSLNAQDSFNTHMPMMDADLGIDQTGYVDSATSYAGVNTGLESATDIAPVYGTPTEPPMSAKGVIKDGYEYLEWSEGSTQQWWYRAIGTGEGWKKWQG